MKIKVDLDNLPQVDNPGRVAILRSKWYPEIVDRLSAACQRVLRDAGFTRIEEHTLPGSLELPLAAADLCENDVDGDLDALICFGVIVKGDTYHFEMISDECMRGLGQVMYKYLRPVAVEVLPVNDIRQAEERAQDDEFNKGIEAAAAAIEMIAWRRSIAR